MKAMILAAGRGRRMRPLTDNCPKALLEIQGKPIIVYLLESLKRAGVSTVVINHAHLGDIIESVLGDGNVLGLEIQYSREPSGGYETGGGVVQALPLLGTAPFILLSGDILTDFDFKTLCSLSMAKSTLAHIILAPNPAFNQNGDFGLQDEHVCLKRTEAKSYNYAGIGLYRPALFAGAHPNFFPLRDVLIPAISAGQVSGQIFEGFWENLGTPEQYQTLTARGLPF